MITKLVIVGVVLAAALILASLSRRSPGNAGPVLAPFQAPSIVDRSDLATADVGSLDGRWVVLIFSSDVCDSCAEVVSKARPLESDAVAVLDVSFQRHRALHEKYSIDAVPLTLIVDPAGAVVKDFSGPVSATHLWAAVAEAREPGSTPEGCGEH